MKKLIAIAALALMPLAGWAAGGGPNPFVVPSNADVTNHAAIQRGAKYFVNYCMGCHSAKYVRYQLMKQVGLSEDQIKENLIFDDSKIGGLMTIAMANDDAAKWFGAAAPDLTLESRLRHGPDWIYSYLKGFYTDPSRPMGVNNTVFKNVGMPNVLWELEGIKEAVYRYEVHQDGHTVATFDNEAEAEAMVKEKGEGYKLEKVVDRLELVQPGELSAKEFDLVARDLATYLAFIGEPIAEERKRMGVWVILFLTFFTVLAYLMKKEWWKDVH
jgi:ubiquinol-cytochrome c reductase cytochrome c1 subunit